MPTTTPPCCRRYVHDGAEKREDSFGLSVSDGERSATTSVAVRVALVDDERPVPLRQRRGRAEVDEAGSVVLTSANIAATDNDTNDGNLVFSIVQSPQFGDIEVGTRNYCTIELILLLLLLLLLFLNVGLVVK